MFSGIFFLIFQGLFIDIIDDFIIRDIDNEVISNLSILNFIVFTYTLLIFFALAISSLLLIERKNLGISLALSFACTILLMNTMSYFLLKSSYGVIGINFYFHAQGLFMVFILGDMNVFFIIQVIIFITMFTVFINITNKD